LVQALGKPKWIKELELGLVKARISSRLKLVLSNLECYSLSENHAIKLKLSSS